MPLAHLIFVVLAFYFGMQNTYAPLTYDSCEESYITGKSALLRTANRYDLADPVMQEAGKACILARAKIDTSTSSSWIEKFLSLFGTVPFNNDTYTLTANKNWPDLFRDAQDRHQQEPDKPLEDQEISPREIFCTDSPQFSPPQDTQDLSLYYVHKAKCKVRVEDTEEKECVFVCFSGSATLSDVARAFHTALEPLERLELPRNALGHSGAAGACAARMKALYEEVKSAQKEGKEVFFVGHSFGALLARISGTVCAHSAQQAETQFSPLQVITFAMTPPDVFSGENISLSEQYIKVYNFKYGWDLASGVSQLFRVQGYSREPSIMLPKPDGVSLPAWCLSPRHSLKIYAKELGIELHSPPVSWKKRFLKLAIPTMGALYYFHPYVTQLLWGDEETASGIV